MAQITDENPAAPLTTNEEIWACWRDYHATRLQPITHQHYGYEIQAFLSAWPGVLVSKLAARDLWAYIGIYSQRCRHFRRQGFPIKNGAACDKKQDLTKCGKDSCTFYEAVLFHTVDKHLQAIVSLYDVLVRKEALSYNFVRDVKRAWVKENQHLKRKPPKRVLTKAEINLLVHRSHRLNRKILYAILAKTGVRIREALLLRCDAEHMNLAEGWLKVPYYKGKRRGNRILIIDDELRAILVAYLEWRERWVRRDAQGKPTHDRLIISHRGIGFDPDQEMVVLAKVVRPDCVRLKIMKGDEPRHNRITPHSFRHFFSDEIKRNGIDPYWWNVLRGDVPRGNEQTYVHPSLEDIRGHYRQHAPDIGPPPYNPPAPQAFEPADDELAEEFEQAMTEAEQARAEASG